MQSGLFESEVGPGIAQSSVQQPYVLQECERHKAQVTEAVPFVAQLLFLGERQ